MCSFNVYHIGTLEVYQPSKPKWGTQKWFQIRYFLYAVKPAELSCQLLPRSYHAVL